MSEDQIIFDRVNFVKELLEMKREYGFRVVRGELNNLIMQNIKLNEQPISEERFNEEFGHTFGLKEGRAGIAILRGLGEKPKVLEFVENQLKPDNIKGKTWVPQPKTQSAMETASPTKSYEERKEQVRADLEEKNFGTILKLCARPEHRLLRSDNGINSYEDLLEVTAKRMQDNPGLHTGIIYKSLHLTGGLISQEIDRYKTTLDADIFLAVMHGLDASRLSMPTDKDPDLRKIKLQIPFKDNIKDNFETVGGLLTYTFFRYRRQQNNSMSAPEIRSITETLLNNGMISQKDSEGIEGMIRRLSSNKPKPLSPEDLKAIENGEAWIR